MIKLGKLWLKNFKSFYNPILFDLSGKDIVVLDGPNGFGKTTVFDAIELCFTKKIGRIFNTDTKLKGSHFLKNKANEETLIFLELIEDNRTKVIIFIKIPANTTKTENKTSSNAVEHKLISSWPTDFSNLHYEVLDNTLESVVNNPRLPTTFSLFNYIQQEDTCHFLKQKEIDRHKQISYLFGTNKESNERDNFTLIQTALSNKIGIIKGESEKKVKLKTQIEENYSQVFERFKGKEKIKPSGVISQITNLDDKPKEQLSIHQHHLSNINWVLTNSEAFLKQHLNYQINTMVVQREQQIADLLLVGVTKSYTEVQKLDKHIKWLNIVENKSNRYQELINAYEQSPNEVTIEELRSFGLAFPKAQVASKEKLNDYRILVKEQGSYEKVLNNINTSRANLKKHYEDHLENTKHTQNVECPLCGDIKITNDQLWIEYTEQGQKFETLISESSTQLKNIEKDLLEDFIKPIIVKSKHFIKQYLQYTELKNVLSKRLITEARWDGMQRIKKWVNENTIEYTDLVNQNVLLENENCTQQNILLLKSRIRALSESVESDLDYSTIKNSLLFYGLKYSDQNLTLSDGNVIQHKDILHDTDYVSYLEYKSESSELKLLDDEIKKIDKQEIALGAKLRDITKIIASYTKQIKKYESAVAKQIAIPFYIYSSKILQTRPDGNGIFLQTAETTKENNYIRFVSDLAEDHDAWNTMSSGQLSGLIISFMLAMNKVYPTNLATLLIDDPVQTMDEINMASFVQLLKYEFPDTQIVLSTHERKVANYFSYRYQESGRELDTINMKNVRLNR
jgi:exonuclease SbcC